MPATFEALAVLVFAVVPGYLAIAAWSRAKTWAGLRTDLETVVRSIAVSLVIQVLFGPITITWIYPYWQANKLDQHPSEVGWWLFIVILVIPLIGGTATGLLSNWFFTHLPKVAPIAPSAWDEFFDPREIPPSGFIIVEFADGKRIGGGWGTGSYAITSPQKQGLVLAVEWELDDDGQPINPRPDSAGVLIPDAGTIKYARMLLEPAEQEEQPAIPRHALWLRITLWIMRRIGK